MKKKLISLFVLIGFIISLIISFILLKNFINNEDLNKPNQNLEETKNVLSNNIIKSESSKIKSIRIKNEVCDFTIEVKSQDEFFINELPNIKKEEVKRTLESLSNLSATKIVSENENELETYGLKNPKCQIIIKYNDEEEKVLYLGANTPINSGAYLKLKGESKIYVISLSDANFFSNSPSNYKN